MKKSRYFSDLIKNYIDEIDDLVTDSEGKSVLQKRLTEKRREIDATLPMIEFSPEMVSFVFYGAFEFRSPEIMQQVVLSEPGDAKNSLTEAVREHFPACEGIAGVATAGIPQGALIAEKPSLIPHTIKAPRAGRVIVAGSGQILMEVREGRVELHAGLPGVVTQIIPDKGVVIRTAGALVQGVWGNGRIDNGLMISLLEKPDDILVADRLDVSLRGSVILGGHVRDLETLKAAAELPVRGLILSSLPSSLIEPAYKMRYPILVTEGYCNCNPNDMTTIEETLAKDSQAGSAISQDSVKKKTTASQFFDPAEMNHQLQSHPYIHTADYEAPNTLKL